MSLLNRVLRVGEGRRLKALEEAARTVNSLEDSITPLSDEELRDRYGQLRDQVRERIADGEDPEKALRDVQAETFAVVREAGWRALGMRHFDVQIMGGYTLGDGTIAEMKTGEGKTLVATLAVCFRALAGRGVHLVTVNDYLAQPRRRLDGAALPLARRDGRRDPVEHAAGRAQGGVRLRRHVRDELRVRLRLPARQPRGRRGRHRPARPLLRDRGRGRLDPDRRGAHAADHLRAAGGGRGHVLRVRAHREAPHDPRGLRGRREAQDGVAVRGRRAQGREGARRREPLRARQRAARQPPDPVAARPSRSTSATSSTSCRTARSRSSTSSPAASWRAGAGPRACTRRSRPRRA